MDENDVTFFFSFGFKKKISEQNFSEAYSINRISSIK